MGEERDRGWLGVDMALREVHVVVVGLAEDWYLRLEAVILKCQLLSVLSSFLGHE